VLDLAGTDVDHLRGIWSDEGERDTHLGDCNKTLNEFFSKAWTQSNLSVHLKAEHHLLKIQVTVVEGGKTYFSTFGERSDGLKAFVALVAFSIRYRMTSRPSCSSTKQRLISISTRKQTSLGCCKIAWPRPRSSTPPTRRDASHSTSEGDSDLSNRRSSTTPAL
jgi:hypothetical protein